MEERLFTMADWQEFEGGQAAERYVRMKVTLNVDGAFYFGKRAFEALGMPEAVKLYFDVVGSRIGIKAVQSGEKTFTDGSFETFEGPLRTVECCIVLQTLRDHTRG